jgi:GDP-L-fucose synthase
MRKLHEAKESGAPGVAIWGTGTPRREFLHVDDMAEASLYVMGLPLESLQAHTQPRLSHVNIGTGRDVSIRELAELMAEIVGYRGELEYDTGKPDGTPQKRLDVSRLGSLGCRPGSI